MAKKKNNNPAKRRGEAKVAPTAKTKATPESAKELTERTAAEWAKSHPGLVEQFTRAAEYLKKLPAPPGEAELAERAEARKKIERYIAIRDRQIPPPWAEKNRPERTPKHIRKGGQTTRLLPLLRELYPPDGVPPADIKTVAVMQRVLNAYQARGWGKISRETVEQAIGRGRHRKR